MMKKFTSFLLIAALLAFMFSFSVTVFADYETDGGYEEIQIYGSESDGDYAKNEKSVKIFDLKNLLISLAVGALIGFIVVSVMKSKLKSVHRRDTASNYALSLNPVIEKSDDTYLSTDTYTTPKAKPPEQ